MHNLTPLRREFRVHLRRSAESRTERRTELIRRLSPHRPKVTSTGMLRRTIAITEPTRAVTMDDFAALWERRNTECRSRRDDVNNRAQLPLRR